MTENIKKNVFWPELRDVVLVGDAGSSYVAKLKDGSLALVSWEDRRSREAQRVLAVHCWYGDAPKFDPSIEGPQIASGVERVNYLVVPAGACLGCGGKVFRTAARGSMTPIYPLGYFNTGLRAEEHDMSGEDQPLCFTCANDRDAHARALSVARGRWTGLVRHE